MSLAVFADADALAAAAAARFASLAQQAVAARGRFLVALSGGSTPQALFALLARPPFQEELPWQNMHLFWGDERLVPPTDPGSSYGMAQQLLLAHVPVPAAQVYRAKGELLPAAAAADYARQLAAAAENGRLWPRFDLCLMGLGSDGHTASLFPGPLPPDALTHPVIAVTAAYDGRPAQRISLTPPVFNDARHVLFLVAGAAKAAALAAVLAHAGTPEQWPARRIQPHAGTLDWYADAAAARAVETP